MTIEFREKTLSEGRRHFRTQKMPYPYPRQRSKPNLKRTSPVDSTLKRVVVPPVFKLADNRFEVPRVRRRQECLRQQHQVLMAVDLPNDLVIARNCDVKIRDESEVITRRLLTTQGIPSPLRNGAVIDFDTEYWDPALQHLVGQPQQFNLVGALINRLRDFARRR